MGIHNYYTYSDMDNNYLLRTLLLRRLLLRLGFLLAVLLLRLAPPVIGAPYDEGLFMAITPFAPACCDPADP